MRLPDIQNLSDRVSYLENALRDHTDNYFNTVNELFKVLTQIITRIQKKEKE